MDRSYIYDLKLKNVVILCHGMATSEGLQSRFRGKIRECTSPGSAESRVADALVCMRNLADVVCGGLELCIRRSGSTKIRLHPAMATLVYPSLCAVCTEHWPIFVVNFGKIVVISICGP